MEGSPPFYRANVGIATYCTLYPSSCCVAHYYLSWLRQCQSSLSSLKILELPMETNDILLYKEYASYWFFLFCLLHRKSRKLFSYTYNCDCPELSPMQFLVKPKRQKIAETKLFFINPIFSTGLFLVSQLCLFGIVCWSQINTRPSVWKIQGNDKVLWTI